MMEVSFENWLTTCKSKRGNGNLSVATVKHYSDGLKIVSDDALKQKTIDKRLEEMSILELDLAISLILTSNWFKAKDDKGNHMYSNAVKRYRCYVHMNSEQGIEEEKQVSEIKVDNTLSKTEKMSIIKSRIGQGIYRERIMKKYNSKCIITGVDIKQTLVASHIKPWAVCSNDERLSADNGLLLTATYDRLFDSGLITFDYNGTIKLSSMISDVNRALLHLQKNEKFDIRYNIAMKDYLDYHHKYIFVA